MAHLTSDVVEAVRWLRDGGIVAFPTDTFYGLAADPRRPEAVDAIFAVKGRDARAAVPLIAASAGQVESCLGRMVGDTRRLAETFWPGALSLIVDAPSSVADAVHGGHGTVAVRVPDSEIARALASGLGFPITATSANRSGQPPASRAAELDDVRGDARVIVLDCGPTAGGAPSTIVDARSAPARLVRAGAIAWERVLPCLYG